MTKKPEIKNLKKAASRLLKAIKSRERIIIYGDADLDGVSSVIIIKESLKTLGGALPVIYFPDREKEGYGLTEKALLCLKEHAPALLLTLDCGIGNFTEVEMANALGFEVIIVDHHEILEKLPKASLVIDPKQKGDSYPFKTFATVGLAFKISEALFKNKMPELLRRNFLELVAMATIADMMPKTDENEIMIAEGLNSLKSTWRPALQVLLGLKHLKSLDLLQRVYKVNSLLNARDIENQLPASFRMLVVSSREEAKSLVENLLKKDLQRRERIKEIMASLENRVGPDNKDPVIFEGDPDWDVTLQGIVASLAVQKYQKPVFLYKTDKEESQGGIRAPSGFNVVEAMRTCSGLLATYGGHPQAAGFRLRNENLDKFKKCLIEYFSKIEN